MTDRGKRLAVVTVTALLGAVMLVALTLQLASDPNVGSSLGDDVFRADAERLAAQIDEDGPVLLPDLRNADLIVYLQHIGDDPTEGWFAFESRAPGAGEKCQIEWRSRRRQFVDSCDGRAYPADGSGLRHFSVTVRDGDVVVDLRSQPRGSIPADNPPSTTNSAPVQ